jgi:hypothetical protein
MFRRFRPPESRGHVGKRTQGGTQAEGLGLLEEQLCPKTNDIRLLFVDARLLRLCVELLVDTYALIRTIFAHARLRGTSLQRPRKWNLPAS